jgi:hypothetical protein
MRRPKEKLIAGLDLHGNNVIIGVINQDGKRVAHRKLDCDLKEVTQFLEPLKPQLQSMAVESTFNWYWLLDGLREEGYPIDLANPAKMNSTTASNTLTIWMTPFIWRSCNASTFYLKPMCMIRSFVQ